MVSALVFRSKGVGLEPGQGLLSKTPYSHSTSLHPGVLLGTSKFNAGGNPAMVLHPIQGEEKLLVASQTRRSFDLIGHLACMQTKSLFLTSTQTDKYLEKPVKSLNSGIQ